MSIEQNLHALRAIRAAGRITRQALADQLGISQSQATKMTADLVHQGLVFVNGKLSANSTGRKADWLGLVPQAAYAIGIQLNNSRQIGVVTDLLGEVVYKISEPAIITDQRDEILRSIKDLCERIIHVSGVPAERIAGLGLGLSDMVDPVERTSYGWPDTPGWSAAWTDFPVGQALEEVLPFPFILVDDIVRMLGLAEARYGTNPPAGDFIYILVDQGVGMAILLDGHAYIGHSRIAGELAHIPIGASVQPCSCGNLGCLHTQVDVPAVLALVSKRLQDSPIRSNLRQKGSLLTIEDVLAGAEKEDKLAVQVLGESGDILGQALGIILNLLGPRAFIVGGALSRSGHFLDAARRAMKQHALNIAARGVTVEQSQLDEWGGARGAATQVLDALFEARENNLLAIRP